MPLTFRSERPLRALLHGAGCLFSLSGALVALAEMYWTGIIQRIFKANATNVSENKREKAMRPSAQEPALAALTDGFIALDRALFGRGKRSVGKGFVLRKR